jgi:phosphoserine phosphatase RsbU/P
VAEAAQRALLPDLPEHQGPVVVAGWYVSATEEALMGGDLYDVMGYQQSARWIIGDVKGKGIEAVRMAAGVLGAFRESAGRLGQGAERHG